MGTWIDFDMIRDSFAFHFVRPFYPIYCKLTLKRSKYVSSAYGTLRKKGIREERYRRRANERKTKRKRTQKYAGLHKNSRAIPVTGLGGP
jgi:hypothetical protein